MVRIDTVGFVPVEDGLPKYKELAALARNRAMLREGVRLERCVKVRTATEMEIEEHDLYVKRLGGTKLGGVEVYSNGSLNFLVYSETKKVMVGAIRYRRVPEFNSMQVAEYVAILKNIGKAVGKSRSWTVDKMDPTAASSVDFSVDMIYGFGDRYIPRSEDNIPAPAMYKVHIHQCWGNEVQIEDENFKLEFYISGHEGNVVLRTMEALGQLGLGRQRVEKKLDEWEQEIKDILSELLACGEYKGPEAYKAYKEFNDEENKEGDETK